MLQRHSDFFFRRPVIYFGSFDLVDDETVFEEDEIFYPFLLDIDPKHPLLQDTGLYLQWRDT